MFALEVFPQWVGLVTIYINLRKHIKFYTEVVVDILLNFLIWPRLLQITNMCYFTVYRERTISNTIFTCSTPVVKMEFYVFITCCDNTFHLMASFQFNVRKLVAECQIIVDFAGVTAFYLFLQARCLSFHRTDSVEALK